MQCTLVSSRTLAGPLGCLCLQLLPVDLRNTSTYTQQSVCGGSVQKPAPWGRS
jgi:hypothetical protein